MPTFKVFLTRMVEEIAEVEVEAIDADDARNSVLSDDPGLTATWTDGDTHGKPVCWRVEDAEGNEVIGS